jgi:catechol 2,3-dioxygenase-like lactoylglutathione lyase family enzyme
VDFKLELVIIPVTDIDVAKDFYTRRAGFRLDVDHSAGDDFRVVQLTPPGSACSITLMRNPEAAGSVHGLHLVVSDIDEARADLTGRGVEASEPFHFSTAGQTAGHHPGRESYGTFLSFSDPDGNTFLVQEVRPGEQRG